MVLRLRPAFLLCLSLGAGLSAVSLTASAALAEGSGLAAALPAGAAFAAPAIAVIAAMLVWRLLRMLGGLLTIGLAVAIAIAALMIADGRLDMESILAPLEAGIAAWL
jgi:hypothetical protein